jgi:hypothetical protein
MEYCHYDQIRRTLPPRGHRNVSSGVGLAGSRNRIPLVARLPRLAEPLAPQSDNVASSLNETNQNQNRQACSTLKSSTRKTRHWKCERKIGRIHADLVVEGCPQRILFRTPTPEIESEKSSIWGKHVRWWCYREFKSTRLKMNCRAITEGDEENEKKITKSMKNKKQKF